MILRIDATFENGVFVPVRRPALPEHDRVRLTVEPANTPPATDAATIQRRRTRRIRPAGDLAERIATEPEFHPDGE